MSNEMWRQEADRAKHGRGISGQKWAGLVTGSMGGVVCALIWRERCRDDHYLAGSGSSRSTRVLEARVGGRLGAGG
jgi:hypothetical protein